MPGSALAPPPRTLWDIVQASADLNPDATALDDGVKALSYDDLLKAVRSKAAELTQAGLGAGDKIGVRIPSGTSTLYLAILAIISIGAAYVPVDADDPEERAALVFGEAQVAAVLGDPLTGKALTMTNERPAPFPTPREPLPTDDAWVIFTSGSTGTPKGVAVSNRSAAAFVDAEASIFLQHEPIGPDDRVLAVCP